MMLGKHFSLEELTASKMAERLGYANQPDDAALANLRALVENVLDPLREIIKRPISISSGYRCPMLNVAIGGAVDSQHVLGQAADIYCAGIPYLKLAQIIASGDIPFDQCILEPSWVHVSYGPRNQREVMHYPGHKPYLHGLPNRWPIET